MAQFERTDVRVLRERLRNKAAFLGPREAQATGFESLDRLLSGGLPKAALTVLIGLPGSGRMTIAARVLAEQTRAARPVAWIDAEGLAYPPALAALGVDLTRLLMVRGAQGKAPFAAEQIIDTGVFETVVISGIGPHLTPSRARRLQTSTEGAKVITLVILEPEASQQLQGAALKLHLTRRGPHIQVEVVKDRLGQASGRRCRMTESAL
jgi:hypothetical protein